MTDYRLVVTRIDPNPAYDAEEARRRGAWPSSSYIIPPTSETQVLDVRLTAEEYQAVKRAVLAVTAPQLIGADLLPPAGENHDA